VAQSAAGAANGSSCANAYAYTWFNTVSSWGGGAGDVDAGDTVHLCGTITGTGAANTNILIAQGSGSSDNLITIIWEEGAKLSSPACSVTSGCFSTNNNSYLRLDGNSTIPSITSTDNGSPAGGFGTAHDSVGIHASGCDNCEFKNLTIANIYMFTDSVNDHSAGGYGIRISGSSDVSIHNCTFDQMQGGITSAFANGDTNIYIYQNTFDNVNHGIEIGNNNSNVISNVFIYGNHFKDMVTWDSASNDYHHDGIIFYQNTAIANTVNNFYIYNEASPLSARRSDNGHGARGHISRR